MPSIIDWEDEMDLMAANSGNGLTISEDENKVYVEAALPGIKPEDVEVTFEKGTVWIKGEVKEEEEDKKKKYYRKASRSFSYRVAVPGEIDLSVDPEAVCNNGVMTIEFAKHPKSQPRTIKVKNKK